MERIAVIGLGDFGKAIAITLSHKGAEVMAIDNNQSIIDKISDEVAYAVCLDATDKKALLAQDIRDFDAVVIAIGNNFEERLICAANLLDFGVKKIICRSLGESQRMILQKMGINEFLSPEDEVGTIVAERLMNPNIVSYLQLPDDYRIAEVIVPKYVCGKSLGELNMRDYYKISLITIRRMYEETINHKLINIQHTVGVPDSKTIIQSEDTLVLFGKSRDIERFIDINQ